MKYPWWIPALGLVCACALSQAPALVPELVPAKCTHEHALEMVAGAVVIVQEQGDKDGAFSFAVAMLVTLRAIDLLTEEDVNYFRGLLIEEMRRRNSNAI